MLNVPHVFFYDLHDYRIINTIRLILLFEIWKMSLESCPKGHLRAACRKSRSKRDWKSFLMNRLEILYSHKNGKIHQFFFLFK